MRTKEKHLWEWLRLGVKMVGDVNIGNAGFGINLERVENAVGRGMPDAHGIAAWAREFWIELKAVPREALIDCELDTDQVLWHRRHALFGGRSWILVQVGTGRALCRYLIPGARASQLARPLPESVLVQLAERSGDPQTAADFLLLAATA